MKSSLIHGHDKSTNNGLLLVTTGAVVITTAISCYMVGYKLGQQRSNKKTESITRSSKNNDEAIEQSSYNDNNVDNNISTNISHDNSEKDIPEEPLRILRKAETAILKRTSKMIIVIERCTSDHNYSAILRTAEALGIQHVWLIDPVIQVDQLKSSSVSDNSNDTATSNITAAHEELVTGKLENKTKNRITKSEIQTRGMHHLFAQNATEWLTIREFKSTSDCIHALREGNYNIWVTDLSQEAVPISSTTLPKSIQHNKIAVVFGTEAVGASNELLQAADLRIYLPLYGFADSLNLSVATALVLQTLYHIYPNDIIGSMSDTERTALRKDWYIKLASQRLYTSKEKKTRVKYKNQLKSIEELERKQKLLKESKQELQPEQKEKIQQKSTIIQQLHTMESNINKKALNLVQDKINNPPKPFIDMRRADQHRICYVGKNTKQKYCDAWKDMPATKNYGTDGKILNSVFMVDDSTSSSKDVKSEN